MGVIHQSIVIVVGGALPGQNHLVIVAVVTEDHGVVAVHLGGIGNTNGAVRETGVDHGGTGINSLGSVDFGQAALGHFNGHNTFTSGSGVVGNREEAVSFLPGGDEIGAGSILEELQNNVALGIGQTLGQSIRWAWESEGVACSLSMVSTSSFCSFSGSAAI